MQSHASRAQAVHPHPQEVSVRTGSKGRFQVGLEDEDSLAEEATSPWEDILSSLQLTVCLA